MLHSWCLVTNKTENTQLERWQNTKESLDAAIKKNERKHKFIYTYLTLTTTIINTINSLSHNYHNKSIFTTCTYYFINYQDKQSTFFFRWYNTIWYLCHELVSVKWVKCLVYERTTIPPHPPTPLLVLALDYAVN